MVNLLQCTSFNSFVLSKLSNCPHIFYYCRLPSSTKAFSWHQCCNILPIEVQRYGRLLLMGVESWESMVDHSLHRRVYVSFSDQFSVMNVSTVKFMCISNILICIKGPFCNPNMILLLHFFVDIDKISLFLNFQLILSFR